MRANEREETDEEFLARLAARLARKKAEKLAAEEAAKPRLVLPVSQETAERHRDRVLPDRADPHALRPCPHVSRSSTTAMVIGRAAL